MLPILIHIIGYSSCFDARQFYENNCCSPSSMSRACTSLKSDYSTICCELDDINLRTKTLYGDLSPTANISIPTESPVDLRHGGVDFEYEGIKGLVLLTSDSLTVVNSVSLSILWHRVFGENDGDYILTKNSSVDAKYFRQIASDPQSVPFSLYDLPAGSIWQRPVIDIEHGLVWAVTTGIHAAYVVAFQLVSGTRAYQVNAHSDRPASPYGNPFSSSGRNDGWLVQRSGLVIEWIDDVPFAYLGFSGAQEYTTMNSFEQQVLDAPGVFSLKGMTRKMNLQTEEIVWSFYSMPRDVHPDTDTLVPDEAFRLNESRLMALVALAENFPIQNTSLLSTEGNHIIYPILNGLQEEPRILRLDPEILGESLKSGASLVQLYHVNDSVAELINATVLFEKRTTISVLVGKGYSIQEKHPWDFDIAYSCNYYGAGHWVQDMVLEEDYVMISYGNAARQAWDEVQFLSQNDNYIRLAADNLRTGSMTQLEYVERVTEILEQVDLSPRGKRALHGSIAILNKHTGALVSSAKMANFGAYNFADLGGFGYLLGMVRSPLTAQKFGRPINMINDINADLMGPLKLNSKIGTVGKNGVAILFDRNLSRIENTISCHTQDIKCDHGVFSFQEPSNLKRVVVGYPGSWGGSNYHSATDGHRLFAFLANYPLSKYVPPDPTLLWTSRNNVDIPAGTGYVTAVSESGDIVWETPVNTHTMLGIGVSEHNGIVYCAEDVDNTQSGSAAIAMLDAVNGSRLGSIVYPEAAFGMASPVHSSNRTFVLPGMMLPIGNMEVQGTGSGTLFVYDRS